MALRVRRTSVRIMTIMAKVQIVFGSNSGNTEMVCQYLQTQLLNFGHDVSLDRCEHFPENQLLGHDLLIIGCSTYEHGALEDHFRYSFWPRIQGLDLKGQKCAAIGLGDSKYDTDYNIESGRIIERYFNEHGGNIIIENLMINKSPLPQLETKVKKWAEKLNKIL